MPEVNSAEMGGFVDMLEDLRTKWAIKECTLVVQVEEPVDPEVGDALMVARYDAGAWLVSIKEVSDV